MVVWNINCKIPEVRCTYVETMAPLHTSEIRSSRGGTEASVFFKSSPKWFSCAARVEKNLRVHTNPLGILLKSDSTSVGLGCGKSWDSAFLNKPLNYGLTNYAQEGGCGPPAKNGFCSFKALFKRKVKEYVTESVWVDAQIKDLVSALPKIRSVRVKHKTEMVTRGIRVQHSWRQAF